MDVGKKFTFCSTIEEKPQFSGDFGSLQQHMFSFLINQSTVKASQEIKIYC